MIRQTIVRSRNGKETTRICNQEVSNITMGPNGTKIGQWKNIYVVLYFTNSGQWFTRE